MEGWGSGGNGQQQQHPAKPTCAAASMSSMAVAIMATFGQSYHSRRPSAYALYCLQDRGGKGLNTVCVLDCTLTTCQPPGRC